MSQVKTGRMEVFEERLYCDLCSGEMKPTNMRLDSFPPRYPHVCEKCGWTENMCETYPRIVYRPVEPTVELRAMTVGDGVLCVAERSKRK